MFLPNNNLKNMRIGENTRVFSPRQYYKLTLKDRKVGDDIIDSLDSLFFDLPSDVLNTILTDFTALKNKASDIKTHLFDDDEVDNEKENDDAKRTVNYSDYIKSKSTIVLPVLRLLSLHCYMKGLKSVKLRMEAGELLVQSGSEYKPVKNVIDEVKDEFKLRGHVLNPKYPDHRYKYIKSATSKNYAAESVKVGAYRVGIDMTSYACIIMNGDLAGNVKTGFITEDNMSSVVFNYLIGDDSDLVPFHVDRFGVKTSGKVQKSSYFQPLFIDYYKMGITSDYGSAVCKANGIINYDKSSLEAKRSLFEYLKKKENDGDEIGYVFDPSWIAEDVAKVKKTGKGEDELLSDYGKLLTGMVVYLGEGNFKYGVIFNKEGVTPYKTFGGFLGLLNAANKMIKMYSLLKVFYEGHKLLPFRAFLSNFNRCNRHPAFYTRMLEVFSCYLGTIDFDVKFNGISVGDVKNKVTLEDFGDFKISNAYDEDYESGLQGLRREKKMTFRYDELTNEIIPNDDYEEQEKIRKLDKEINIVNDSMEDDDGVGNEVVEDNESSDDTIRIDKLPVVKKNVVSRKVTKQDLKLKVPVKKTREQLLISRFQLRKLPEDDSYALEDVKDMNYKAMDFPREHLPLLEEFVRGSDYMKDYGRKEILDYKREIVDGMSYYHVIEEVVQRYLSIIKTATRVTVIKDIFVSFVDAFKDYLYRPQGGGLF